MINWHDSIVNQSHPHSGRHLKLVYFYVDIGVIACSPLLMYRFGTTKQLPYYFVVKTFYKFLQYGNWMVWNSKYVIQARFYYHHINTSLLHKIIICPRSGVSKKIGTQLQNNMHICCLKILKHGRPPHVFKIMIKP